MPSAQTIRRNGIRAALLSALVLGTTPILGKMAYAGGMNPYSLTAIRTLVAAALLWVFYLSTKKNRKFIYIYPAGLLISAAAGALNGASSLLYYNGLTMIDAGVGQMLYSLYPLFVVIIRRLDGQRVSNWTKVRLGLALLAVTLLITPHGGTVDWVGAALMLGAGLMYAMHLAVSQRVLYEMPAPTVALYVLTSMTAVVCAAYLLHGPTPVPLMGLPPTLMLAGITVTSRLLMFLGVKQLGSIQTALLGVTEILVTVILSIFVLGEQLVGRQWIGAAILITSLLLIIFEPGIGISLPFRKKKNAELVDQKISL
ncbi:MAG TPA: DMT family transporter [Anaerolineae bacterium]|nr:DMT family transporter [Anaerolineae bacterium]